MRGKSGTLARAAAQLPEETGSWCELWALHPATPWGPAPARLCAGFGAGLGVPLVCTEKFLAPCHLGLDGHPRLLLCPPRSPAPVHTQQQKELPSSVKLNHFLVSKCRAGNAARAGLLWKGTAGLAQHRGFPSLQPRTVPACGTRTAPACSAPLLQRQHWGMWRKGLIPPAPAAPSKEQCPRGHSGHCSAVQGLAAAWPVRARGRRQLALLSRCAKPAK